MKTAMSGVLVFLFFLAGIPGIDAGSGGAAEPAALNPGEVVELSGDIKIVGHEPFVQTVLETPSGTAVCFNRAEGEGTAQADPDNPGEDTGQGAAGGRRPADSSGTGAALFYSRIAGCCRIILI